MINFYQVDQALSLFCYSYRQLIFEIAYQYDYFKDIEFNGSVKLSLGKPFHNAVKFLNGVTTRSS